MSGSVDHLARLVAFPTVSRDGNGALIAWLSDRLTDAGARLSRIEGEGGKSSLLATVGPDRPDGLVLSAHSDVVPVEGQAWTSDPFTLAERDGRLHARGAVDMKGFLACMLSAAEKAGRGTLARPLHLAVSYDEEIGCIGVRPMLAALAERGFRAAGCIVGEPTGLQVATGHKGKIAGRILCRGQEAHSADPTQGCNAINLAAGMIATMEALQEQLTQSPGRDESYPLPYSTVHAGLIRGGTALNIVPGACEIAFEMRLLPRDGAEPLIEELRSAGTRLCAPYLKRGRRAEIEVLVENAYPGLDVADDAPLVALVRAASGSNALTRLGFGTEAGLFQSELALPAVVCGPGSIDRAHKADEYITRGELAGCDAFLARLVDTLAS